MWKLQKEMTISYVLFVLFVEWCGWKMYSKEIMRFPVCLQEYEEFVDTVARGSIAVGVYRSAGQGYIAGCTGAGVVQDAADGNIYGSDTDV